MDGREGALSFSAARSWQHLRRMEIWQQLGFGSLDAAMGHGLPGTIIFFRGPIWNVCQNQKVVGLHHLAAGSLHDVT